MLEPNFQLQPTDWYNQIKWRINIPSTCSHRQLLHVQRRKLHESGLVRRHNIVESAKFEGIFT